jgi:hypothetical protein
MTVVTQTETEPESLPNLARPTFDVAMEDGDIVHKGSCHQPGTNPAGGNCNCRRTTKKGAYRDVSVRMGDGRIVHYYHQSPVVVENGRYYKLDSHGYKTMTTKERINRHIPAGYYVRQEDFTWYLETPDGRVEFEDGMIIEA